MAKQKRKSKAAELAQKRLAGLESISTTLNLGNGLTIPAYSTAIQSVLAKLDAYNTQLSVADTALNDVESQEKILRLLSERFLEAVGSAYGHDSNEYEKAGGTRTSERKRPVRKPKKTTP